MKTTTKKKSTHPKGTHEKGTHDPELAASEAGLRYVHDHHGGFTRKKRGKVFHFFDPAGKRITDTKVVARIQSLGIPPAWVKVWICPLANGHLQATGQDVRGRKQYRYHPRWREVRDESKFDRMLAFARALPRVRAATDHDLRRPGLPKEKVVATVVRLLETTLIRVGNEEYARENESYGLTTMRDEHVDVKGSRIRFHFRGKSGKEHEIEVHDRRLATIVSRCEEIPGHELFHYVDPETGVKHLIESSDVNAYLHQAAGADFTAKDFRTWAGTVLAARALEEKALLLAAAEEEGAKLLKRSAAKAGSKFPARGPLKKHVVDAVKLVAGRLGNTPTVARKSYIHPIVIEAFLAGMLHRTHDSAGSSSKKAGAKIQRELRDLPESEAHVLMLLEAQIARAASETLESTLAASIKQASA
jgi:DNA topoisomerase-1